MRHGGKQSLAGPGFSQNSHRRGSRCIGFSGGRLAENLDDPGSGKMIASRYIARLMGPVLLAIGIGMVVGFMTEGDGYPALMKEFLGSRALIFLTGALTLVAGLAIVNAHNLWVPDWRVVVTVLGWAV